jgi:hypothetical protein
MTIVAAMNAKRILATALLLGTMIGVAPAIVSSATASTATPVTSAATTSSTQPANSTPSWPWN